MTSDRTAQRADDLVAATDEFLETGRTWLTEITAHADALGELEPPGGFDEHQTERRTRLAAVEDGLLRRSLFVATKPRR